MSTFSPPSSGMFGSSSTSNNGATEFCPPGFVADPVEGCVRSDESLQQMAEPDPDYVNDGAMFSPAMPALPKAEPMLPPVNSALEPPCVGTAQKSGGGQIEGIIGKSAGGGWRLVAIDGNVSRARTKGDVNCTRSAAQPSNASLRNGTGPVAIDNRATRTIMPPCEGDATATDGSSVAGMIEKGKNNAYGGWYKITNADGTVTRIRGKANVACRA